MKDEWNSTFHIYIRFFYTFGYAGIGSDPKYESNKLYVNRLLVAAHNLKNQFFAIHFDIRRQSERKSELLFALAMEIS